jgi:hypothetical protein
MNPKIVGSYVAGLILTLFAMSAVPQQQVQASSFFGDLGRDLDEGIDSYQQGSADGRAAGIADYPNNDNDCPSGHSTAYCAGWSGGYRTGFNAQRTLDESGRHSGNGDNDDDDEN